MVDVEDAHRVCVLVDRVADAVLPATCPPVPLERCAQGCSDATRRPGEGSGDEFPGGEGSGSRQVLGQGAPRTGRQQETVGRFSHWMPQRPAAA